jgi:Fe-S-cluster containining protein
MDEKPWFHKGLRFECTQCGDCCTGAPGYVWVNRDEIEELARHLNMRVADFEQAYVRQVGIRKSLIEYANGDCVFFDPNARKCTVYDARPRQCRTWPFWDSNTRTPEAWKATCQVCPGSGKGKLHSAEQILHQISVVKV